MNWLLNKYPFELLEKVSQNRDKPIRKVAGGVYNSPDGPMRKIRMFESWDLIELKVEGRKKIATITKSGQKVLENYRKIKELMNDKKI